MLVCAVAMAIGMRSSMRLKLNFSSAGSDSQSKQESVEKAERNRKPPGHKKTGQDFQDTTTETKKEKDKKASQKELLVIKQALTVVLIQIQLLWPLDAKGRQALCRITTWEFKQIQSKRLTRGTCYDDMSAQHTGHALTRKDQWLRIRQELEQQHANGNNRISSRSYQSVVSTRTATTGSAAIARTNQ
ncbi:hypothetical protein PoB_000075800 [Plakobranchus ocellatus]|uniref:Uncharacterized protein n=1 Tax=Plakobranchus ocellatus TaxID=259542 RepID=A0AAV3XV72_9GAST|nr:hypothetical protein PoB_000075800 [Plakobranchus ocellatus]